MTTVTLDSTPLGSAVVVGAVAADPVLRRRLAELGIRCGEAVVPLHATSGGGRLLAVGDTRVALARDVLRLVAVEPVEPA